MPRRKTIFQQNGLYHVTNRGALKTRIFEDEKFGHEFLNLLRQLKKKYQMTIVAYCLMPNHFHLLIRQDGLITISKFMKEVSYRFACYYNRCQNKTGAVFQNRFWSDNVQDEERLYKLTCYIHLNPVKAGLCSQPANWNDSNFLAFNGVANDSLTDTEAVKSLFGDLSLYRFLLDFYSR